MTYLFLQILQLTSYLDLHIAQEVLVSNLTRGLGPVEDTHCTHIRVLPVDERMAF
jgi:hypothetical protein